MFSTTEMFIYLGILLCLMANNRTEQATIDLEPSWNSVYNMVRRELVGVEELHKLVVLGDMVRSAQKQGKSVVIFPDGRVEVRE